MTSTTQKDTFKPNIERFTFTGSGGEYFKIWIVNILLTIVTLGIYSAWAKVRNKQYFYGNTYLAGSSFEYTAEPKQILKGRIIAFIILVLYTLVSELDPRLKFIMVGTLFMATPWIIMKSIAFNAYYSEYRNVRFGFHQNWKEAFMVFVIITIPVVLPFIALIAILAYMTTIAVNTSSAAPLEVISTIPALSTLLVTSTIIIAIASYPYVTYRTKKYISKNHSFGRTQFQLNDGLAKSFYGIYIKAILLFFALFIILFTLLYLAGLFLSMIERTSEMSSILRGGVTISTTLIFPLFSLLIYTLVFAFIRSRIYNLIYRNTSIGCNKLGARMDTQSLASLYITNTLGVIITLGLFIPWAKVRSAKYRADRTAMQVDKNLDEFITNIEKEQAAFGEEFGDVFDIDVAI